MVVYVGKTSIKQHLQDCEKLKQNVDQQPASWEPDPRLCDGSRAVRKASQGEPGSSVEGGGAGHCFAGTAGHTAACRLGRATSAPKVVLGGSPLCDAQG